MRVSLQVNNMTDYDINLRDVEGEKETSLINQAMDTDAFDAIQEYVTDQGYQVGTIEVKESYGADVVPDEAYVVHFSLMGGEEDEIAEINAAITDGEVLSVLGSIDNLKEDGTTELKDSFMYKDGEIKHDIL